MHRVFLLLQQAVACHLCLDLKGSNQSFKSPGQIFKLLHPGYNINHNAAMNTTLLILDHIQSFFSLVPRLGTRLELVKNGKTRMLAYRDVATLENGRRLLSMFPVC